jgi:hypothetical protein
MSRKLDKDVKEGLQDALNGNDGVFETVMNAIDWYFEHNPQDNPLKEDEWIQWHITVGEEILDETD